jgi:hypothetical protein
MCPLKNKIIMKTEKKPQITQQNSRPAQEVRNPELIEKFYKQIVNNFGYAYPGKA